jgi:hypothetical protein
MYVLCSLPYLVSFTAEIQPWNNVKKDTASASPLLVMSSAVLPDTEDGDVNAPNKSKEG